MVFRIILFVWEFMVDIATVRGMGSDEKDLELLILRQQLRIAEWKQARGPQIPRWQKVPLARERWQKVVMVVQPETILR